MNKGTLKNVVKFNKYLKIFLAVLIFLLLLNFGLYQLFGRGVAILAQPILTAKIFLREKFQNLSFLWQTKKNLIKENEELKKQLENYQIQIQMAELVAKENEKLRVLVDALPADLKGSLAVVLAGPKTNFYDTMLIAGNFPAGAKVFYPANILLGEVVETIGKIAKVSLYSTAGVKTEGRLANSGTPVLAIGRGGGNFKINLPRDVEVSLDEAVVVPPNFVLGFVKKIEADPREPEQTIYVAVPVNIFLLSHVFVNI